MPNVDRQLTRVKTWFTITHMTDAEKLDCIKQEILALDEEFVLLIERAVIIRRMMKKLTDENKWLD